MKPSPLQVLARLHGIQSGYRDASGAWRVADPEALRAVLSGMDLPAAVVADPELGISQFAAARAQGGLPPVATVWEGQPGGFCLGVPQEAFGPYRGELRLESGETLALNGRIETLPVAERYVQAGGAWLRRRVPLPDPMPWGYHRLRLRWLNRLGETLLISAPMRAAGLPGDPARPRWGAFLPLYAVRSGSNWGAGDYRDLHRLLTWAGDRGFEAVGTLPLLPVFLDRPFNPSPYAPVSRRFWNEFFIDPCRTPEFENCRAARELVASPGFQSTLAKLRSSDNVDYARVWALKRPVLEMLLDSLRSDPEQWRRRTAPFVEQRPTVLDYARFRAQQEEAGGRPWPQWPPATLERINSPQFPASRSTDFYIYSQLLAHEQLEASHGGPAKGAPALYLDLPLGAHPDGFDSWYYRESFAHGASVGAPPDPIFSGGQDWGFAPLHPGRIREHGYDYFIECVRHHLSHAGILRIDHAMCFHRLFWIPSGMGADRGVYVRYAADEFYAILTLESRRHNAALVGEDLGTVPDAVRRSMDRHGISRTYAMQLELRSDRNNALGEIPDQAVACVNTHDLCPFAAFWAGTDLEELFALGLFDGAALQREQLGRETLKDALIDFLRARGSLAEGPESPTDVLLACVAMMGGTRAGLTLVNLEDLWGERRRQNLPGTTTEHANWQLRARFGIDEFDSVPGVQRLVREITLRGVVPAG